jgi:hypothetical protein
VNDKMAVVARAVRTVQEDLQTHGWRPEGNGEFRWMDTDTWVGFTWTMGAIQVSTWRRSGVTQTRAVTNYGPTTDPDTILMLPALLKSDMAWPPEDWTVRNWTI